MLYATKGKKNILNSYMELESNAISHLSDHIYDDKDARNIPLTPEQVLQLTDYIDEYDDLIDVISRKDGSTRLMLGKKINGHTIIIETLSKGRNAIHPITAYQIPTDKYNADCKTRAVGRSSTSDLNNQAQVEISRPATALDKTIPHPAESRQEENSVVSPEESVGAAPAGFNSVRSDMVGSQDKTVTTDPYMTDEEIEQYNPQHERVGWEDNKTAAYAAGEVHDSSGATAATPTRTRRDGGNAAVFSTVSQEGQSRQEENAGRDETPQRTHNGGKRLDGHCMGQLTQELRTERLILIFSKLILLTRSILSFTLLLRVPDTEAGKAPLMTGIDPNSSVDGKPANEIKSIYGREGVVNWLKLRAKDSSIIIGDEKKASTLLRDAGIETSGPVANADDLVNEILSYDEKAVKPKASIDTDSIGNEDAESLRRRNAAIKSLSPRQVADLLGHSTSEITEMYYVKKDTARLGGITNWFEI